MKKETLDVLEIINVLGERPHPFPDNTSFVHQESQVFYSAYANAYVL